MSRVVVLSAALMLFVAGPVAAQSLPAPAAAALALAHGETPCLFAGTRPLVDVAIALGSAPQQGDTELDAATCEALAGPASHRWWGLYGADGFVVYGQTVGCLVRSNGGAEVDLLGVLDFGADVPQVSAGWVGVALPSTAPERPVVATDALPTQFPAGSLARDGEGLMWTGSTGATTQLGDDDAGSFAVAGEAGDILILVVEPERTTLWAGRPYGASRVATLGR